MTAPYTFANGDVLNVVLSRAGRHDWEPVYTGSVTLVGVQDLPPYKRGRNPRPAGHQAFSVEWPGNPAGSWADYNTHTDTTDGVLFVAEDYLMEVQP